MRRLSVRFRPVAPPPDRPRDARGLSYIPTMNTSPTTATGLITRNRLGYVIPPLLAYSLGGVLAAILLLVLISRLLPQMPWYLEDPAEVHAWLLAAQRQVPMPDVLNTLGLFTITRSPLLRALLILAAVLAWLHVGYAGYLGFWPRSGTRVPPLSPQAAEGGLVRQWARPFPEMQATLQQRLSGQALVAEEHPTFEEARYFLRVGSAGVWGSLFFFLGVILIATGMYWALTFGWETPPTIIAPDQPWDLGHGTGIRVNLIRAGEDDQGPASLFFVQPRDKEGAVYTVPVGGSVRVHGVELRHLGAPLGMSVRVTSRADTPIPLQRPDGRAGRELLLLFPTSGSERTVLIPTYGLEVRIVGYESLPERGYEGPVFLVQVIGQEEETPRYSAFIAGPTEVEVSGLRLTLNVVRHARVQAVYYPGRVVRLVGVLLALVGVLLALARGPLRRVWVQAYGDDRVTIAHAWGDVYNVGWHTTLRGVTLRAWLDDE